MFERYTEDARRVIFFARYDASQFGSPTIETEHLLLALIREDRSLISRFVRDHSSAESIRKEIEDRITGRLTTILDLHVTRKFTTRWGQCGSSRPRAKGGV